MSLGNIGTIGTLNVGTGYPVERKPVERIYNTPVNIINYTREGSRFKDKPGCGKEFEGLSCGLILFYKPNKPFHLCPDCVKSRQALAIQKKIQAKKQKKAESKKKYRTLDPNRRPTGNDKSIKVFMTIDNGPEMMFFSILEAARFIDVDRSTVESWVVRLGGSKDGRIKVRAEGRDYVDRPPPKYRKFPKKEKAVLLVTFEGTTKEMVIDDFADLIGYNKSVVYRWLRKNQNPLKDYKIAKK